MTVTDSCRPLNAKTYFSLLALAKKPGPALVYSLAEIEERSCFLQHLENAFDCNFIMAVKAFPARRVIEIASKYLSGFDVSNQNEMKLLSDHVESKIISLTSPTLSFLEPTSFKKIRAVESLIFNCDHFCQYEALMEIKKKQKYVIRLNSDSLLSKKNPQSRFGIGVDQSELIRNLELL